MGCAPGRNGPTPLPIISVEPFLHPDNPERPSAAAALHAACIEYGFFYLDISSYIDHSEPEELTRLAREFFALPQEVKENISISNEDGVRGASHRFCLMLLLFIDGARQGIRG